MWGQRYTVHDLLSVAEDHGFDVSRRLISDWVSLGLLDKAKDSGRGRGRGKNYTWPYAQLRLFLVLLEKRRQVKRPVLCNVPVIFWLIWGDGYVPLRQTRRALATWAGTYGTSGFGRARKTAREVVALLDHRRASQKDRERLVDLVVGAAYQGVIDRDSMLEVAQRVFNPDNLDLSGAPAAAMTPESYVRLVEARTTALQRLQEIPDDVYLDARSSYLTTGPTAALAQAALAQDVRPTTPGQMFKEFEKTTNRACLDLLTLLGLTLMIPRRTTPDRPSWLAPTGGRLKKG
jgi:hypothetical protein